MKLPRRFGLYWRLLASYLAVILVGCITLYWAGEAFVTYFFDRHMDGVMEQTRHMDPMREAMAADLNAAYRRASERSMTWGLGVSALVASIVGLFVTRRIVAPVRRMQHASRRIAAGQYRERLVASAPGEIGELATSFNEMAQALERIETRRVELLANVAHEFRTPLTNLRGYMTGFRDGILEPDEETLEACTRQLARLERLVTDLSLLSKVETGIDELRPRTIRAAELTQQNVASVRPRFAEKGVTLCVQDEAGPVRVNVDTQRTAQVFGNLLENALRYTSRGGEVRVSTSASREEVRFEVEDTGSGIPPEELEHVFTRFHRVDKARSYDPARGSGIGLTIAKHYVERQGGRIGVESEWGRGTRFWFCLPRASVAGE